MTLILLYDGLYYKYQVIWFVTLILFQNEYKMYHKISMLFINMNNTYFNYIIVGTRT